MYNQFYRFLSQKEILVLNTKEDISPMQLKFKAGIAKAKTLISIQIKPSNPVKRNPSFGLVHLIYFNKLMAYLKQNHDNPPINCKQNKKEAVREIQGGNELCRPQPRYSYVLLCNSRRSERKKSKLCIQRFKRTERG